MNTRLYKRKTLYVCEKCKIETANKYDYTKHLNTQKHKKNSENGSNTNLFPNNQQVETNNQCVCEGGNGCRYHYGINSNTNSHCTSTNSNNDINQRELIASLMQQNQEFKQLMTEQNQLIIEHYQMMKEQNQKIIELSKNQMTMTNSHNNNNTTNNKFNLNFFLNEQCKNAINLPDFVNSLKLTIADLERVGQLGYADGISRIFVRGLKDMDVFKRPIHCSDAKRETFYVRDKDIWEKEDEEKNKIKVAIRKIAHNNFKQLSQWAEEKPEHKKSDTKEYNEWVQIMHQSAGGGNGEDKNYQKIIKNVIHATTIEKDRLP
jgi:hypothetical protein